MKYDPNLHHRRSIRLQGYDYARAGAYFITICSQNRACLFGDVDGSDMRLNEAGNMVVAAWDLLTTRFPDIGLDAFVVMPNHVHGIIVLTDADMPPVGAPLVGAPGNMGAAGNAGAPFPDAGAAETRATTRVAPTALVGAVVGAYKSLTTVKFARGVKTFGWPPFAGKLWQRNYYEHIIRNEAALNRIRRYIVENPARWAEDTENPAGAGAI